jgi:hypothetical protein
MAQHIQINKCNTTQKQNQGQQPYAHLNKSRKTFAKIEHPFMIKVLKKLGTEGIYLNIIGFYGQHQLMGMSTQKWELTPSTPSCACLGIEQQSQFFSSLPQL